MRPAEEASNNNNSSNNSSSNVNIEDYYDDDKSFGYKADKGRWKNERGDYFGDGEENCIWKRLAYIGVLLVLGSTCAMLSLLKICGVAGWMSTATFSVILMGAFLLLIPGIYYARILVCICFRCRDYSLFDVPAGPFG